MKCNHCGDRFTAQRRTGKFCSAACRNGYSRHLKRELERTEWHSPVEIVEAARAVMGGIDLDPASCAEANVGWLGTEGAGCTVAGVGWTIAGTGTGRLSCLFPNQFTTADSATIKAKPQRHSTHYVSYGPTSAIDLLARIFGIAVS